MYEYKKKKNNTTLLYETQWYILSIYYIQVLLPEIYRKLILDVLKTRGCIR